VRRTGSEPAEESSEEEKGEAGAVKTEKADAVKTEEKAGEGAPAAPTAMQTEAPPVPAKAEPTAVPMES